MTDNAIGVGGADAALTAATFHAARTAAAEHHVAAATDASVDRAIRSPT